jgi:hypothetical protein
MELCCCPAGHQFFEPERHAGDENTKMANTLLPLEERNLTPDQVELLDKRRRRGQLFLVLSGQCLIVSTLLTLWSGQDLTISPPWAHLVAYWNAITITLTVVFGITGLRLRRGSNEFLSY